MNNHHSDNKRPRLDATATGIHGQEMQSTNSTLNRALGGGPQRSWMNSQGQGTGQSTVQARTVRNSVKKRSRGSRQQPPQLNTSRRASLAVINNVRDSSTSVPTPVSAQAVRPNWPNQEGAQINSEPRSVNTIDLIASPECFLTSNENLQHGAILPSPAPSDETPQNIDQAAAGDALPQQQSNAAVTSTHTPDSNEIQKTQEQVDASADESANLQNPKAPSANTETLPANETPTAATERLTELAAWFGGVEELEKHLQLVDRTQNRSSFSPSTPNSQSVTQPGSHLRGMAQAASYLQPQPTRRPSNPTSISPFLHPSSTAHPSASGYMDPPANSMGDPRQGTQQMAMSSSSLHGNRIRLATPINNTTFQEAHFQAFLVEVNARQIQVDKDPAKSTHQKDIERSRLTLLAEACNTKDVPFLLIHQWYCLCSLPNCNPGWTHREGVGKGLSVLSGLLLPNSNVTIQSTEWFANFPVLIENLAHAMSNAFTLIFPCLIALGAGWHGFNDGHRAAGLPPTIWGLQEQLGIASQVLQRVIFKSVYRSFWVPPEDGCFKDCIQVFEASQKLYPALNATLHGRVSSQDFNIWNRQLVQQYRRLSMHHGNHSQALVNSAAANLSEDSRANGAGAQVNSIEVLPISVVNATGVQGNATALLPNSSTAAFPPRTTAISLSTVPPPPLTPLPAASHSPVNMDFFNFRGPPPQIRQGSQLQSNVASTHANQNRNNAMSPQTHGSAFFVPQQPNHRPQSLDQSRTILNQTNQDQTNQLPSSQIPASRVANPHSLQASGNSHPQIMNQHINSQVFSQPSSRPLTRDLEAAYASRIMDNILLQNGLPASNRMQVANSRLCPNLPSGQPQPQQGYQTGIPVHQAHLYDAISIGPPQPTTAQPKLLSYFKEFLIQPVLIKSVTQTVRSTFQVDAEMLSKLPKLEFDNQVGVTPKRDIKLDSLLIRIRSVKAFQLPISEEKWAVSDTDWPPSLVLFLNCQHFEVRRKAGWGKDLAVDLTGYVREGANSIEVSFMKKSENPNKHNYALAVEVLAVTTGTDFINHVRELDAFDTQQRIQKQLSSNNDEVEIISSDLIIKVTDPFSSQLINQPVRGKSCVHYECFDLQIFLATRKNGVNVPEQNFRCPVCGCDARPTSLQIDNWFVEVLSRIREMKEEDARAIVVDQNAGWRIQEEEKEGESGDGGERWKGSKSTTPGLGTEPIVIDLGD